MEAKPLLNRYGHDGEDRSEHGRKIGQALVVLQLNPPSPDCLPHGLEGVAADGRREVHNRALKKETRDEKIRLDCLRRVSDKKYA
jgi:hypothetical protein